jgi:hypothetical protein
LEGRWRGIREIVTCCFIINNNNNNNNNNIFWVQLKVKLFHYRPGYALAAPGG